MSQIKRYVLLFWLTLKSVMKPSSLLIFIVRAPASLGLIAGLGNRANLTTEVRVAIVDELADEDSADMIDYFRANHWDVLLADHETAEKWLSHGAINAIIKIKPELRDFLAGDKTKRYVEVEQPPSSLIQLSLMMTITSYADAEQLIREFEDELSNLAARKGQDKDLIREQYQARMSEYKGGLVQDPVIFENRLAQTRKTVLVGDYSLLLLYLAVAAVSQTALLKRPVRRLLAVPGAFFADFSVIYLVNFLLGFMEVLVYSLSLSGPAGTPWAAANLPGLVVYLLELQALAFWLLLMPEDTRLFCGLFLTFLLALIGGVLFPLPGNAMLKYAQFTPLGWAMAALSGLGTDLPPLHVAALALLLTLLAALAVREQGRKKSRI